VVGLFLPLVFELLATVLERAEKRTFQPVQGMMAGMAVHGDRHVRNGSIILRALGRRTKKKLGSKTIARLELID
jgi:hypothetical protein